MARDSTGEAAGFAWAWLANHSREQANPVRNLAECIVVVVPRDGFFNRIADCNGFTGH